MSFVLFEQFGFGELLGTGAVRGLGRGRGQGGPRRAYRFAREVLGPAQRRRRPRGLPPRGRPGDHAEGLQGRVEASSTSGLQDARRRARRTAGRARPLMLHGAGRGDALRREHRVQHVPGPGLRRGRGHRRVRHARAAASATSSKHVQRHVGRHDVPHRAARRPDVGAARTTARSSRTARYSIKGTKIFISGGDHDLAENIVHLVLARVDGAPPGTKGLSLFIVPKMRINADGTLGEPNDVTRRRPSSTRWASTARRPASSTSARTTAASASSSARVENVGHVPDVPDDERRAHRRRHPGRSASRRPRTCNALEYAKDRKQGPHYQAVEGPDRAARRRSSSTPTCAACCST